MLHRTVVFLSRLTGRSRLCEDRVLRIHVFLYGSPYRLTKYFLNRLEVLPCVLFEESMFSFAQGCLDYLHVTSNMLDASSDISVPDVDSWIIAGVSDRQAAKGPLELGTKSAASSPTPITGFLGSTPNQSLEIERARWDLNPRHLRGTSLQLSSAG